ncbi:MAG: hypothetical protein QE271_00380 [Bacteriovoracaceae bacterium]|nr:hypothetical protein [Bacteriovoracaceae bacterium]
MKKLTGALIFMQLFAYANAQTETQIQIQDPQPEESYASYRCRVVDGPSRGKYFVLSQNEDPSVYGYNLPIGTNSAVFPGFADVVFKKAGFDTVYTYANNLKFAHPTNPEIYGSMVYKGGPGSKRYRAEFIVVADKVLYAYKTKCKRVKK